jgi:hypothetical protein
MTKITRWKPDTCECVIEYSWDTEVPQDLREHVLSTMQSCPLHAGMVAVDAYQVVLGENQLKNQVTGEVMEQLAIPVERVTFSYTAARRLQLTIDGIDNYAKATLQSVIEEKFGKCVDLL